MEGRVVTCGDLEKVAGKPECCRSCHGYEEELEGDGENFNVCCVVGNWLVEVLKVDIYEEVPAELMERLGWIKKEKVRR